MNHAADDEEKLFYLENVLSMFGGTYFGQMWYAEFEDYMYQIVESGSALDPEVLGDKWMELLDTYRAAMDYFSGLVDEYDRLVDAKLSAEGADEAEETADAA